MPVMGDSRRRPAPLIAFLAAVVVSTVAAVPAAGASFDPAAIVFPVIGDVQFTDTFDAPRSGGRTHQATDIMTFGVKGLPVVAAADGVVSWIGTTCCYLAIDHGNGWETWYIHLDNDTAGTDDGLGWGIAPGIARGTPVAAGQLIGWVGDSGNAEDVGPHLHFEIRLDDVAVNPYPYLLSAPRLTVPGTAPASSGRFVDDDGSVHESDIETLFATGITVGCSLDPPRYCPDDLITRGQIAAFVYRALSPPPVSEDFFSDDEGSVFEDQINAVTALGIGFGCGGTEFCPDRPLLRSEMAEVLVRAFGFAPTDVDYFTDDAGNPFEASINRLKAAGITKGCSVEDPALFCPDRPLTRAEMASFFVRAMGL
jgi:hypothetical protein